MRELYSDVNNGINCCSYGDHSRAISDSSVDDAIKKRKIGKSDGYDGLISDYIINFTPLLTHYLSLLFSLMLSHCYTPTSFCVSTMIPLPKKGSGSMNDIRNYRGIALSSLLSSCLITVLSVINMILCVPTICSLHISQRYQLFTVLILSMKQLIITSITQVKFMRVHWMPLRHLIGFTY